MKHSVRYNFDDIKYQIELPKGSDLLLDPPALPDCDN